MTYSGEKRFSTNGRSPFLSKSDLSQSCLLHKLKEYGGGVLLISIKPDAIRPYMAKMPLRNLPMQQLLD